MKKSGETIYTEAAELIHDGRQEYSCNAISVAEGRGNYYRQLYIETMGDYNIVTTSYYLQFTKVERAASDDVSIQELRVMLLLMMAACYEDMMR